MKERTPYKWMVWINKTFHSRRRTSSYVTFASEDETQGVLTFESVKSLSVTIQVKAVEQYFIVVLFKIMLCKVVRTFGGICR